MGRGGEGRQRAKETENEMFSLTEIGVDSAFCLTRCAGIPIALLPQDRKTIEAEFTKRSGGRDRKGTFSPSPPHPLLPLAPMWHGIEGHDDVVERFRRALARGRLASSFLFAGPAGIGKRTFAMKLAQALLCQTRPEEAMDPCGHAPPAPRLPPALIPTLTWWRSRRGSRTSRWPC